MARELLCQGMVVTRTTSWVGLFVVTAAALLGACGRSSSHGKGLGEGAGGEGAGNAAGAAGNSDEPEAVTDAPLAPGSCGVVRRIQEPGGLRTLDDDVMRQNGGFSVGPKVSSVEEGLMQGFFIQDTARRWRTLEAGGWNNDLHWSFMFGPGPQLADVYLGAAGGGGDDWGVRVWQDGDAAPTLAGSLLRAPWRGTDGVLIRPSLDGEHAVFAIWPIALSEPRAALIGPDGHLVGDMLSLAPADHRFSSCQTLTPTAHGAIISFVDTADSAWYLYEVGAGGIPAQVSLRWPDNQQQCPLLSVDDTGVYYLLQSTPGSAELTHVTGGSEPTGGQISPRGSVGAFTSTPHGTLLLEYTDNQPTLELLAPEGAQSFALGNELGVMHALPAEAGRIFIETHSIEQGTRTIVELGCN